MSRPSPPPQSQKAAARRELLENVAASCQGGAVSCQGGADNYTNDKVTVQYRQVAPNSYLYQEKGQVVTNSYLSKESLESQSTFFDRENLCTQVKPRCGQCKCGKCPVPGSRYTHREEGELKMIKDNLKHNGKCWETSYPFLYP